MQATVGGEHAAIEDQVPVVIPDFSVKELMSAIPPHCFQRSALRSSSYAICDLVIIAVIYQTAAYIDTFINPDHLALPSATLYPLLRFALWASYAYATGLPMLGLWVCAHECGHQAFSESETFNNTVGWILHSSLGVPYQAWRITHAKHHAATGHLTEDQVWVPRTRSDLGLPPFDPSGETLSGSNISKQVMNELWEALGDTPIMAAVNVASYFLVGWPMYLITNASGQMRYPARTNHFNPYAVVFKPHQYGQVILSDIGVFLWLACIAAAIRNWGFLDVFRVYLAPYLWLNHWLIVVTFLHHTDPLVPRYRQDMFTFQRGALTTLDRNLLGGFGSFMGYIGACVTHGISETHVVHHINSKIPHYHAWEATDALRKRLAEAGINLQGAPGGWSEMYRVFKQCKFVEDEGSVVFYKNAYGQAAGRPIYRDHSFSDSGVDLDKKNV